jgi:hypothetical protein
MIDQQGKRHNELPVLLVDVHGFLSEQLVLGSNVG